MRDQSDESEGLLTFLWHHRIWWIAPAVSVLLLVGALVLLGGREASAPFVYTLF